MAWKQYGKRLPEFMRGREPALGLVLVVWSCAVTAGALFLLWSEWFG